MRLSQTRGRERNEEELGSWDEKEPKIRPEDSAWDAFHFPETVVILWR